MLRVKAMTIVCVALFCSLFAQQDSLVVQASLPDSIKIAIEKQQKIESLNKTIDMLSSSNQCQNIPDLTQDEKQYCISRFNAIYPEGK